MVYESSRRDFLKLGFRGSLAAMVLTSPLLTNQTYIEPAYSKSPDNSTSTNAYQSQNPSSTAQEQTQDTKRFVKLLENILSRGFPVGEVLLTRFGLEEQAILSLPKKISKEEFRKFLEQADKRTTTTARLRVPTLRPDRPTLDGQDIYEGFFAPSPGMFDYSAPLEGSISRLSKQGYNFTEEERNHLDEMLKTCLKDQENNEWYALPVGSRISITSGKSPEFEIWINEGPQLDDVDETIKRADYDKKPIIRITNPGQIAALNKHYNLALTAKDEQVKKNSKGKFKRIEEKLYDVLTTRGFKENEFL